MVWPVPSQAENLRPFPVISQSVPVSVGSKRFHVVSGTWTILIMATKILAKCSSQF